MIEQLFVTANRFEMISKSQVSFSRFFNISHLSNFVVVDPSIHFQVLRQNFELYSITVCVISSLKISLFMLIINRQLIFNFKNISIICLSRTYNQWHHTFTNAQKLASSFNQSCILFSHIRASQLRWRYFYLKQ